MRTRGLALVVFLTTSAAMAEPLADIKIVNDRAPDCSSLESIVESVTRGCQTDDERVIALYNFGRYAYYHHAYPGERSGVSALKMINVYGWSLCGGQHTVLAALWEAAGYRWRYRGWSNPGHTTVEVFYGGRWHYLDTFLKFYAWMPDPDAPGGRTIAGQEDLIRDPTLITEAFFHDQPRNVLYQRDNRLDYYGEKVNWTAPAFLVCGDGLEGVLSGVRSSRDSGSPRGWASIRFDGDDYSTAVDLPAGYLLGLRWDKSGDFFYFNGGDRAPGHSCGDKDYRNCPAIGPLLEPYAGVDPRRSWSNGQLVFRPDMGSGAFLSDLEAVKNAVWEEGELRQVDSSKPGVIVVKMASPYIVARALNVVTCDDARTEVSTDLENWIPVTDETTKAVAGTYRYYVRVTFDSPITTIKLASVVQHNQEALPYLAPGRNRITVTSSDPTSLGDNRLVITYVYRPGSRGRSPEEMFDRDEEVARAHSAEWLSPLVVVQKTFEKLPATFEILVPTPEGRYPVYPRMLSLIRQVVAPGGKPRVGSIAPTTPTVGPGETLAELPNPWRIGTTRPPKQPERETKTVVVPASKTSYVSKSGDVFDHHFIKWLKDDSEAWVLLVDFEPDELPAMADLASAKIVFRAIESHASAPMQAAAVRLEGPFTPGEVFDFSKLGKTIGWTIVERGDGPGAPFAEPRRYEINITREVRAWIRGQPSHGMALRIVPNRGIDDGWTVRFTPRERQPVELEISTYVQ